MTLAVNSPFQAELDVGVDLSHAQLGGGGQGGSWHRTRAQWCHFSQCFPSRRGRGSPFLLLVRWTQTFTEGSRSELGRVGGISGTQVAVWWSPAGGLWGLSAGPVSQLVLPLGCGACCQVAGLWAPGIPYPRPVGIG